MFGKLQTTLSTAALLLVASTATAGFADNDLELVKPIADDLLCQALAIELDTVRQQQGYYFSQVDQGCIERILTYQPQLLQHVRVSRHQELATSSDGDS